MDVVGGREEVRWIFERSSPRKLGECSSCNRRIQIIWLNVEVSIWAHSIVLFGPNEAYFVCSFIL